MTQRSVDLHVLFRPLRIQVSVGSVRNGFTCNTKTILVTIIHGLILNCIEISQPSRYCAEIIASHIKL